MLKVIIEIPKAYGSEFLETRFESTLMRLSADANLHAGNYEKETANMLVNAFKRATIMKDITNGE